MEEILKVKLFEEYLARKEVPIEQSVILQELGTLLKWEYRELFNIYLSSFQKKDYYNSEKEITCKIEKEGDILICREKKVIFQHEKLLNLLIVLCDLVEEILPVGSV